MRLIKINSTLPPIPSDLEITNFLTRLHGFVKETDDYPSPFPCFLCFDKRIQNLTFKYNEIKLDHS